MKAENISFNTDSGNIVDSIFANGGTLYPVFLVVFVPIFLKFIHPLFQKFFPGILKQIGIGLCLVTVNLFCSLFIETFAIMLIFQCLLLDILLIMYIMTHIIMLHMMLLILLLLPHLMSTRTFSLFSKSLLLWPMSLSMVECLNSCVLKALTL